MIRLLFSLNILLLAHISFGQTSLQDSLEMISKDAKGAVGVSILNTNSGRQLSLRGKDHFPMQSVFKFPLALKVLHEADKGKLSLDQKVHIDEKDWMQGTWSPMRDFYKSRTTDITVREILRFTVSASDNNGCDILFRLVDGPPAVHRYIHSLGIRDIAIVATEADMHKAWDVQ